MVTLVVSHTVISMQDILTAMETGERQHMKPSDYIALHLLELIFMHIILVHKKTLQWLKQM